MLVRDLGALAVSVNAQEQAVVGTRGAAMLARLAVSVNQRVSQDALMEAAWGDQVSTGAASTLESHVWRLRQLLEPGRRRRQPPTVLVSDGGGFRLIGGPSTIDSLAFTEAVSETRDLLAAGHAEAALDRADAALALWRGRPYGAFAEAEWAVASVARLDELRAQLQERRVEALLASGVIDLAVSDLQPLIAEQPYAEALRGLQMTALYRSGRSEEALQVYHDTRRVLVDEVGIEPGAPLRELYEQILRNDEALNWSPPQRATMARKIDVHLPPSLTPLIGRKDVCERLESLIGSHRLVSIKGPAGCGKTRVAVEVARSAAPTFPDGVWFVDLGSVSDPDLTVDVVCSTIGFAVAVGATPLENLATYLRPRRLLLVLDNCEHLLEPVSEIIELTLGGGHSGALVECVFLTTSREPLSIDGEVVWQLDPLTLPNPNDGESVASSPAVQLFLRRLRGVAPMMQVSERDLRRIGEICTAVDGLPLPIELAAARVPSHSLDDIATQTAADPTGLARVGRAPHDHRATVRSTIEWSYRLLDDTEKRAHRRLSVLPGPFTTGLAATVLGRTPSDADDLLAQLVHRSMLASEGSSGPGRPTLFRQLVTVRHHATHALSETADTPECRARRDDWVIALLRSRPPLGTGREAEWYLDLDDDYPTVRSTLTRMLIEEPQPLGGRLANQLAFYWYYRERLIEAVRWLRLGHEAVRDDPTDSVLAATTLGAVLAVQGRLDLAQPYIADALARLHDVSTDRLEEIGEALVGLAMGVWVLDAHDLVAELHRKLTAVADWVGSDNLDLLVDAVGCCAAFARGELAEAVRLAEAVHERATAVDNPMASWISTGPPMITALLAGRPAAGIPWVERCLAQHLRLGTGAGGMFIETRAGFAVQSGDFARAAKLYGAARTETRRAAMRWPRRDITHEYLAITRKQLSTADFERSWQEGERQPIADIVTGITLEDPTGPPSHAASHHLPS